MANEQQRQRWNDDEQVRNWPKRERITTVITEPLLGTLKPQPGEHIVEIGSGGGLVALEAARAVGASGRVTGFDLSRGMVEMATRRAKDAWASNVRFVSGDAQVDAIPDGPFDAAMSQFGVMFFADPVAAFANIRRHLRSGGRLAMACWQPAAKNTWFPGTVLAKYAQTPPAGAGSGPQPGPFAFGDPEYVGGILRDAGFTDFHHEPIDRETELPEDSVYDRGIIEVMNLDPARAEEAWQELSALVAPMRTGDGNVRMRLAVEVYTGIVG